MNDNFLESEEQYERFLETRKQKYLLGLSYLNGTNGPKDLKKAFELIQESCDEGFSYAINAFGAFYGRGIFVEQDFAKAIEFYNRAFRLRNPKASYNLYQVFHKGLGVEKSDEKAQFYLEKSFDFALPLILQKDDIAYDFFSNDLNLNKGKIDQFIESYRNDPNCDVCQKRIKTKNAKSKHFPVIDGMPSFDSFPPNSITIFLKAFPLVKNGICCFDCFFDYVQPLAKKFEMGLVSHQQIDHIFEEFEGSDRLEKLEELSI